MDTRSRLGLFLPAVIDFFPTTDPDPDLKRGGGGGRAAPLRGCAPAP